MSSLLVDDRECFSRIEGGPSTDIRKLDKIDGGRRKSIWRTRSRSRSACCIAKSSCELMAVV